MDHKFLIRTVMWAIAGCALAIPALAQWQWLDRDGRKVFSDRPPPGDIAQKSILKEPGARALNPAPGAVAVMPAPAAVAPVTEAKASRPRLSGKDAELEARKKEAEAREETTKQADAEQRSKAMQDNCERAQRGQATLKSGVRITLTNARGESEFMDDAARSVETKRLQAIAESDCAR